jgi:hypothetical protein
LVWHIPAVLLTLKNLPFYSHQRFTYVKDNVGHPTKELPESEWVRSTKPSVLIETKGT